MLGIYAARIITCMAGSLVREKFATDLLPKKKPGYTHMSTTWLFADPPIPTYLGPEPFMTGMKRDQLGQICDPLFNWSRLRHGFLIPCRPGLNLERASYGFQILASPHLFHPTGLAVGRAGSAASSVAGAAP